MIGEILQSGETKDRNHQDLSLLFHLQLPHDEERQKSKSPVRNRIQHRNNISQNHNDIGANAFAMVIGIEIPPERNGSALEGNQQTVGNGEEDVEDHDPADDPDVDAVDSDAEKEKTDADFEGCSGQGVEDFAKEPVLFGEVPSLWVSSRQSQRQKTHHQTHLCSVII